MVQIVNDPNYGRNGAFEGINSALQGLVSHKVGQIQQKQQQAKTAQGLKALLPDLSHKDAHGLALLDPKILEQVVKQKMQAPQEEALASALSGLLGNGQQEQQQQMQQQMPQQQEPENVVGEFSHWQPTPQDINLLPAFLKSEQGSKMFTPEQQQEILKEIAPHLKQEQPKEKAKPKARLNSKNALELAKLGIQTKKEEAKLKQKEKEFSQKEQHEADKETKPYYEDISNEAKAAKGNDMRLDRMQTLLDSGRLRGPFYNSLFDTVSKGIFGFGIDLHFLQNPETQEFRKLSTDMIKEAKEIFGNRLTDTDIKTFLQTVPSLSMSDEGKEKVIQNLRAFNDAAKIRKSTMDKIIRDNGGRRPRNLDTLVEENAQNKLDVLAERFKGGY